MDTEIKNALDAAEERARYDERAKRLLGNKIILAHILVRVVDELQGMSPRDVVPLIEGDPLISTVPVEPGLTNAGKERDGTATPHEGTSPDGRKTTSGSGRGGQRVVGLNTESGEANEGLVRFDVICYVRMRDGISQVILNLEIQKDRPTAYSLPNRAVFYTCRLISSQKERDFTKMNYDDIKRVYSVWVCMGMDESSMTFVRLAKDDRVGAYPMRGNALDLLNIVLIGIADEIPEHDGTHDLHRLLGALLSAGLPASEKLRILETEYDIPLDDGLREEVSDMCNLSEGIWEKGLEEGMLKGREEGMLKGMANSISLLLESGLSVEDVAARLKLSVDRVRELSSLVTADA